MRKPRRYKFWFHYNKPASSKAGKPQITLHFKGACHIIDNLYCSAVTFGQLRKQQPRFVVAGFCNTVDFHDGKAWIYDFDLPEAMNQLKAQHKHE